MSSSQDIVKLIRSLLHEDDGVASSISAPASSVSSGLGTVHRVGGGISPRASHRTGLDTLASSGSCHRNEGCRLPLDIEFLPLPVDPRQ
jgi:hypothetical protein